MSVPAKKRDKTKNTGNELPPLYKATDYQRSVHNSPKAEGPEPYRTEFRKDYQRLIHSPALRRLQGKTQLFPSEEHDFYRTRLTHSMEVAQVAKSIAIRLNNTDSYFQKHPIDTDLIEFSGLAHDLGHPPFGHNGEYILDREMIDHGGFEGNAQTLRILTKLEKKVTTEIPHAHAISNNQDVRRGINPTFRSIASVVKYDRAIPRTKAGREQADCEKEPCKGYYADEADLVGNIRDALAPAKGIRFKTIECSIMDVADDIAYSTYDLEDAFASTLMSPLSVLASDDSLKKRIVERTRKKLDLEFSDVPLADRNFTIDDLNANLQSLFSDVLELDSKLVFETNWDTEGLATYAAGEVWRRSVLLAKSPYHRTQFTSDLIGIFIGNVEVHRTGDQPKFWQVRPNINIFCAIEALKMMCFINLIESDKFLAERRRAKHIIKSIFDALTESGADLLPNDWRAVYRHFADDPILKRRTICDFVAGMTNRYCLEFYQRLFGERAPSIHKP